MRRRTMLTGTAAATAGAVATVVVAEKAAGVTAKGKHPHNGLCVTANVPDVR